MSIEGQGHIFSIYFPGFDVLCFTWPRYQVSVYRTIGPLVLIVALKHRLWVLIRTASLSRFQRVPTIYDLNKNKKSITIFHLKIMIFTAVKYCSLLPRRVFVMSRIYYLSFTFLAKVNWRD